MGVRRLGRWLAIVAIALHAAWPLIANARPKSVHLVPLCTVEGVTHYIELPGGKSPLDESANTHREHCSFCFLGVGGLLASHVEAPVAPVSVTERIELDFERSHPTAVPIVHGARAPPSSPVVTTTDHNIGRRNETNLVAGRVARALFS